MNGLLGTVVALIAIITFFGAAVVYIRGSKDKGTIDTLEKNNEALMARVDLLEKNEASLKIRVEVLEKENGFLLLQRPDAEAIAALHELLEEQGALLARHDIQTLALLRGRA